MLDAISAAIRELNEEQRGYLIRLLEPGPDRVAIVGMGCRLPGAGDPGALWRLLVAGGDAVAEVPPERWNGSDYYAPDPAAPGKVSTRWGGFLDGIERFDPGFFGISPREAAKMDPQQRLFLEVAWEAMEDAGQVPSDLRGSRTGVFVAVYQNDYSWLQLARPEGLDGYDLSGNHHSIAANRLSFLFDLRGPSLVVDTACSSSLVAVHLACQSLLRGECDRALAGGVNLIVSPLSTITLSKWGMMAKDGRCKSFDAAADGFVRGEGCGVIALKRLRDARRDGDRILAVIRGSAINQDGRTNVLTAPSGLAQQAVYRMALESAGVPASRVSFVETHGTGTALGDPIEVEGLAEVYGRANGASQACVLGAVKTNLGHLEAAAGIAGLIKATLCLRHGAIPPNLHFRQLNPHIRIEGTRLELPTALRAYPAGPEPRCAAVSAFGFGGTNAHVILEEAPEAPRPAPPPSEERGHVLPLSGHEPAALAQLAERYAQLLREAKPETLDLRDVAYTAGVLRQHHACRLAVAGRSAVEIARKLDEARAAIPRQAPGGAPGPVVFVFPGQGSQWAGMGRRLLEREPAFRVALEACDDAIRPLCGWSVREALRGELEPSRLAAISVVQPTLFAVEVALAALWRAWGVTPSAVVGHSMGEVAAAHVAGALRLPDAARIICLRSRLLERVSGQGGMAMVQLPLDEVSGLLAARHAGRLSVAASNGRTSTVVAGEAEALDALLAELSARDVFCRRIKVDVASHSPMVDPLRADLLAALDGVRPQRATIPFHSTVLGGPCPGDALDASYWARNLREPVLFAPVVRALAAGAGGGATFVEISPHPILLPAIEADLEPDAPRATLVGSLSRDGDDCIAMREALARLYAAGHDVDFRALKSEGSRCVSLPTYPWQGARCWLAEVERHAAPQAAAPAARALPGERTALAEPPGATVWSIPSLARALPSCRDHRIDGASVLSASGFLEVLLAIAAEEGTSSGAALDDLVLQQGLAVPDEGEVELQVLARREEGSAARVSLHSSAKAGGGPRWTLHATARVPVHGSTEPAAPLDCEEALRRCAEEIPGDRLYAELEASGVAYGPHLRGVARLRRGSGEAIAQLSRPTEVSRAESGPLASALAVCFQALDAAAAGAGGEGQLLVPVSIERARILRRPEEAVWVHARLRGEGRDAGALEGDARVLDARGEVVALLSGVVLRPTSKAALATLASAELRYEIAWRTAARLASAPGAGARRGGPWLLLADRGGVGEALAGELERRGERCVLAHAGDGGASSAHGLRVDPASPEALRRLVDELRQREGGLAWVVHLWALDSDAPSESAPGNLAKAAELRCGSAVSVLQALLGTADPEPPRLWLVTRGAQATGGEAAPPALLQAPLAGLGKVIALEHPALWAGHVDLDAAEAAPAAAALAEELLAWEPDGEDEVALRGGERRVPRVVRATAPQEEAPAPPVSGAASYLVTGGLGTLGLKVARWLAERGARHIVLLGRSALPPRGAWRSLAEGSQERERAEAVLAAEALGASIEIAAVDVADPDAMAALVARFGSAWPPLRGVVHAAAALAERPLRELDAAALAAMFRAKVQGAWVLHRLTLPLSLDFFVLFSSTTGLWGAQGLGHYAAANRFLDALAHHRRAAGAAALSIAWGTWDDNAGHRRALGRSFEAFGLAPMPPPRALDALAALLRRPPGPQAVVALVDFGRLIPVYESARRRPLFDEMRALDDRRKAPQASEGAAGRAEGALARELESAAPHRRREVLAAHLQREVASVLHVADPRSLPQQKGFFQMGMDSVTSLELRRRIEAALGRRLGATVVFNYPSVERLTEHLLAGFAEAPPAPAPTPDRAVAPPPPPGAAEPGADDDLSEQELLALLQQRIELST